MLSYHFSQNVPRKREKLTSSFSMGESEVGMMNADTSTRTIKSREPKFKKN